MDNKVTWQCPICGCTAYQRYGGVIYPAQRISIDENGVEQKEQTTLRMGTHFMCKGCSIFFSNPKQFNLDNIQRRMNDGP